MQQEKLSKFKHGLPRLSRDDGFGLNDFYQVEGHLESHLALLPANDHASRAIVAQTKDDEARHALDAQKLGALELPTFVKAIMGAAAKVMTTVAHRV